MPDPAAPPKAVPLLEALRDGLQLTAGARACGVVDGASSIDLAYEAKIRFGRRIHNLFLPEMQDALWDVAPYLVGLDPTGDYLASWAGQWGKNAGVLFVASGDEESLVGHLRKIFIVEDEGGQEYFFRFYDPRVLRTFLPTCTAEQLEEFFGPIDAILVEDDGGSAMIRFSRAGGKLAASRIDVERSAAG